MNWMTLAVLTVVAVAACTALAGAPGPDRDAEKYMVRKSEAEWKEELSSLEYYVLRKAGTERPFTGKYNHFKGHGSFVCGGCGQPLFHSDAKFNSGTGWPSFTRPADKDAVEEVTDTAFGMIRTEVRCSKCGGHLGHVFSDGPPPTGLRYCINSASLDFEAEPDASPSASNLKGSNHAAVTTPDHDDNASPKR